MSQQLELLTENPTHWITVSLLTPEIQKKEIKPFVILALKELEGNPDSRTSSLMNADKFSAVREVVRHFARLRSAIKEPWLQDDVRTFLEGLRFNPDCVIEFTTLLCTDKMYENIPTHLRIKPGVVHMQWKIDISLRCSGLNIVCYRSLIFIENPPWHRILPNRCSKWSWLILCRGRYFKPDSEFRTKSWMRVMALSIHTQNPMNPVYRGDLTSLTSCFAFLTIISADIFSIASLAVFNLNITFAAFSALTARFKSYPCVCESRISNKSFIISRN